MVLAMSSVLLGQISGDDIQKIRIRLMVCLGYEKIHLINKPINQNAISYKHTETS